MNLWCFIGKQFLNMAAKSLICEVKMWYCGFYKFKNTSLWKILLKGWKHAENWEISWKCAFEYLCPNLNDFLLKSVKQFNQIPMDKCFK